MDRATPAPGTRLRVDRFAVVVLVLSLVPHLGLLFVHLAQNMPDETAVLWFISGVGLTFMASFAAALAVRPLARHRPRLPVQAFCFVAITCGLGALSVQGWRTTHAVKTAEALAEAESPAAAPALQLPPGPLPRNAEAAARLAGERSLRALAAVHARNSEAARRFWSQGGLSTRGLTNLAAVHDRLAALERMTDANHGWQTALARFPERLADEFEVLRVPDEVRATAAPQLTRLIHLETRHALAQCDGTIAGHAQALLGMLRDHWGAWQPGPNGTARFDSPRLNEETAARQRTVHDLFAERFTLSTQCPDALPGLADNDAIVKRSRNASPSVAR